jgi:hypothetical protein
LEDGGIAYFGITIPALLNFRSEHYLQHYLMQTTGLSDGKLHTNANVQPLGELTYQKLSMLIFAVED